MYLDVLAMPAVSWFLQFFQISSFVSFWGEADNWVCRHSVLVLTTIVLKSICPATICPKLICPTTICPTTICPSTICPTTVCVTTICPKMIFLTSICPTTICPSTICPTSIERSCEWFYWKSDRPVSKRFSRLTKNCCRCETVDDWGEKILASHRRWEMKRFVKAGLPVNPLNSKFVLVSASSSCFLFRNFLRCIFVFGWMMNNFYADSWWKFDCCRHNMVFKKLFDFISLFWISTISIRMWNTTD